MSEYPALPPSEPPTPGPTQRTPSPRPLAGIRADPLEPRRRAAATPGDRDDEPLAYARRARHDPDPDRRPEVPIPPAARTSYVVESRRLAETAWKLRTIGDFRGGRSLVRQNCRIVDLGWLPTAGCMVYANPGDAWRAVDVLRHMNPGWRFRLVAVEEVRRSWVVDEEPTTLRLLADLERLAAGADPRVAALVAEAAAALRDRPAA